MANAGGYGGQDLITGISSLWSGRSVIIRYVYGYLGEKNVMAFSKYERMDSTQSPAAGSSGDSWSAGTFRSVPYPCETDWPIPR